MNEKFLINLSCFFALPKNRELFGKKQAKKKRRRQKKEE
jgi:hypothetical protein